MLLCSVMAMPAQSKSDIQKLVDSEHSFATFAAEHDTKSAFLEFIAPYGVLFQPDKVDGRPARCLQTTGAVGSAAGGGLDPDVRHAWDRRDIRSPGKRTLRLFHGLGADKLVGGVDRARLRV